MRTILFLACISFTCALQAQRTRFSIGPEFSLPTYKEFPSNAIGASMAVEFRSKKRVSANIETGINYFTGSVINGWKRDTIRGVGFIPVLGGIKFSMRDKFYAAMRGGLTIGTYHSFIGYTLSTCSRHNAA